LSVLNVTNVARRISIVKDPAPNPFES